MTNIGFTIYLLGCLFCFAILIEDFFSMSKEEQNKSEIGMIAVGTLMSWGLVLLYLFNYIKQKWNDKYSKH